MNFPKDMVELEALIDQCAADGDARGEMLAKMTAAATDHLQRTQSAFLFFIEEVRGMLDVAEPRLRYDALVGLKLEMVRAAVNSILHADEGPEPLIVGKEKVDGDKTTITFRSHWAARHNAYALKELLRKHDKSGFWNFIEMRLTDPEAGELVLTLQRQSGETPMQKIEKLKARIAELEAQAATEDERTG
jgi:hypothetical protein